MAAFAAVVVLEVVQIGPAIGASGDMEVVFEKRFLVAMTVVGTLMAELM